MRQYVPEEDRLVLIVDIGYQAKSIADDVEYRKYPAAGGNPIGAGVGLADIVQALPFGRFRRPIPAIQLLGCTGMPDRIREFVPGDDVQKEALGACLVEFRKLRIGCQVTGRQPLVNIENCDIHRAFVLWAGGSHSRLEWSGRQPASREPKTAGMPAQRVGRLLFGEGNCDGGEDFSESRDYIWVNGIRAAVGRVVE